MYFTAYSIIKFRKYKLSKAKGWVGKEGGPNPGYCPISI